MTKFNSYEDFLKWAQKHPYLFSEQISGIKIKPRIFLNSAQDWEFSKLIRILLDSPAFSKYILKSEAEGFEDLLCTVLDFAKLTDLPPKYQIKYVETTGFYLFPLIETNLLEEKRSPPISLTAIEKDLKNREKDKKYLFYASKIIIKLQQEIADRKRPGFVK